MRVLGRTTGLSSVAMMMAFVAASLSPIGGRNYVLSGGNSRLNSRGVVAFVTRQGYSMAKASLAVDTSENNLWRWKKELGQTATISAAMPS